MCSVGRSDLVVYIQPPELYGLYWLISVGTVSFVQSQLQFHFEDTQSTVINR